MTTHQPTTGVSVTKSSGWFSVLPSLVIPICLGLSAYFGLQYLIREQHFTNETVLRYVNGHPVSQLTIGMFLVGLASLMLIAMNVFSQFSKEPRIFLDDLPETQRVKPEPGVGIAAAETSADAQNTDVDLAVDHGESLMGLGKAVRQDYLWNRLVNSLHYIFRTGSVAGVEEEMKYLAEMDIERQQQRYSLSRILIWATPMLGFLGTVLGISQALGGIAVGPDNDFQQMMGGLQGSLYVAFDTTALALSLSMVLMFCQFLVDRFEVQLLELVDQKSRREIARQFDLSGAAGGAAGLQVLESTRDLVRDQTEIWRTSIKAAEDAWSSSLTQTSDIVQGNLSEALDENVSNLAHYLGESIEKADHAIAHRWEQWQTMLSSNARLLKQHQESLLSQTDKIQTVVEKLDDATTFKTALDHQHQAVEATTKMHEVLVRVADEVSSQSKQLQKRGKNQSQLLEKSSAAILKSQQVFEQRITNVKNELRVQPAVPTPAPMASSFTVPAAAPAKKTARRRDPKKPVMFLSSKAVTEIREKTQSKTEITPKPASKTVAKPASKPASKLTTGIWYADKPATPQKSTKRAKDKRTIPIQGIRSQLEVKLPEKKNSQEDKPTLLMPQSDRRRQRVRSAEQDDAERLSLLPQDDAQRKKAA